MKMNVLKRLPMRFCFILLVMGELISVTLFSGLVIYLLNKVTHVSISMPIPSLKFLIFVSIIIGGAVTAFLSKTFIKPIQKLKRAMQKVSEGDFEIRLEAKNEFDEIKDIYSNFNLMVKELRATEILQTDFVSNVSHEFKTPINAIEGYATLLQGADEQSKEYQAIYVEKILFNTRKLSNLVGNILLLSKIENQAIKSPLTTFRLDEQIRQSIVWLEEEWVKKDIEFDVELESILYTGSENLLLHVWNNLINNAIKFNPIGGLIELRLYKKEENIVFSVRDNGPGISEQAQKHIFDKFYQSDSSHKEEGNGLGLALVKRILDSCNATISVENVSWGGCRFIVNIPLNRNQTFCK